MNETPLKEHLKKAKYLLFLLEKSSNKARKPSPLVNIRRVVRPSVNPLTLLARRGWGQNDATYFKRLMAERGSLRITHLKTDSDEIPLSFKSAKMIHKVSEDQNLHLIQYTIAYGSMHPSPKKIYWEKMNSYKAFASLKTSLNSPAISARKIAGKCTKVASLKEELLKEGRERPPELALEKQFSQRRNYASSRPLHT